MTQKRKTLIRLRDTRGLLRDLEAARAATAAVDRESRRGDLNAASENLTGALLSACERLERASTIHDVEDADVEVGAARHHVVQAGERVKLADRLQAEAVARLRHRERELRTTERVLERTVAVERRESDKREQRMVDDIIGARVGAGPA